jgi:hypothetical protein
MRLLQRSREGSFSHVEPSDDIPDYAILSHTWGEDEVTYQDLQNNAAKGKKGYAKLIFCGTQAAIDGLQYFWVDTCCINKESSAELSEAINSMFQWYQKAKKCYVYVSNVSFESQHGIVDVPDGSVGQDQWKRNFKESRWFTRSWTLQELLAPKFVEFFSTDGVSLGTRQELLREITEVTGIPEEVLKAQRLVSDIDIEERMSWARNRQAKRPEDTAYSLLGIFDVNIPLIYGEGREKAFKRLRRAIKEGQEEEIGLLGKISLRSSTRTKDPNSERPARSEHDLTGTMGAPPNSDQSVRRSLEALGEHSLIRESSRPRQSARGTRADRRSQASFRYGNQFTAYGGTQNNNTGSGKQIFGNFTGPVELKWI